MKIEHVDGGPWVLTLSSQEASIICYTMPSTLAGYGQLDHPLYMEFSRLQTEVLSAQLIPGSKDSLEAYGEEQQQELLARVERVKEIAATPRPATCPLCGTDSANAGTPNPGTKAEGSANV